VPAAVPIVDLESPAAVAEIAAACGRIGFLVVTGHGVAPGDVARMREVSNAFFDLPAHEKLRLASGEPRRGLPAYRPLRTESLAASTGAKAPPDLKESLDWGPAIEGFGWPDRPQELRETFERYREAVNGLGSRLRRLFALALDLPEGWFDATFEGHSSSLRVINYPAQEHEAEPGQLRAGAHTDYGCMTIIAADDVPGGLQVQVRDGGWLDVHAPPGTFVVNLGDMMARWTNDHWVATLHRVANPPSGAGGRARRLSLVFFHDPRPDAVVECIPTCLAPGEQPRYEPVTALDYILAKGARAGV
jgi:isopenicillin N synthase-like dioxygenase